ncbi:hypothetical protein [Methylobrevis albus]|uniref:Immunity MXAN-0049 protein domain-containing protein n=1 Tax=Methylobrevis albus TaxID=2793297 RepID=A0A931I3Q8_9HYPH|nr:hypothetical protein [Methylobrevis albus]MBH0238743.1 hypothetical protein [Methylobrevis albus]
MDDGAAATVRSLRMCHRGGWVFCEGNGLSCATANLESGDHLGPVSAHRPWSFLLGTQEAYRMRRCTDVRSIIPVEEKPLFDLRQVFDIVRSGREFKFDRYKKLEIPDMPFFFYGAVVFSERAWGLFSETIAILGDYIYLDVARRRFVFYLPLVYVDCFDEGRSRFRRLDTGTISQIYEYGFKVKNSFEFPPIFKISGPMKTSYDVFCNGDFKRIVEQNGLTGMEFQDVDIVRPPDRT